MAEKDAIVRILKDPDGEEPAGAGVLVSADTVLTCDHVVDVALTNGVVHLDFPLIAPGRAVRFRVTRRYPLNDNVFFGEPDDLAVLKMMPGESLPDEANPARFRGDEPDDHPVKLCGFPEGRERGDWAYGELVGPTGEGWIQLDHDLASRLVAPGFSGTAAWGRKARLAAGIVVSRHMRDGRMSAFVIPPKILRKACEEIRFGGDLDVGSAAVSKDAPKVESRPGATEKPGGPVPNESDPRENAGVRVFISYAKEDVEHAKRLYRDLKKAGFSPWLDAEELLPGQNWRNEIVQAVRESRYFVALLSGRGLSRNGFVHRELKKALEVMEEYPEGGIFLIPARLDDCQPQDEKLRGLHWADLFPDYDAGFEKIRRALEFQRARDESDGRQHDEEPRVEVLDPVEDSKKEQKTDPPEPPPKFTNSLGMEFVWIPPGTFLMGSPEDEPGRDDDEKQHKVVLTLGFYLQTTPVTQGQYEAVMGKNPSHFKKVGTEGPVETVSWNDTQDFIRKLSENDPSVSYRLPTEAEWEYACRAETKTAFYSGPSTKPTGLDPNLDRVGWFGKNSGGTTHPVGKKEPNAWGLYDMHGNIWEWCQDWFGDYPDGPVTDPTGPESGALRVRRGGAWYVGARYCRAAFRDYNTPVNRSIYLGFRLLAERQVRRSQSSSG
ncbi:MAG: SUMF1/EgtB/PvdO family nonheme iron enzyme [Desulfococcaceae bacterium]